MDTDFSVLVKAKTTPELMLMYKEWHKYLPDMVAAVTSELNARRVDMAALELEKQKAIDDNEASLAYGKKGSPLYLIFCFLLSLVGGIPGIIGGYIYAYSKTHSYSKKAFFVYDDETRKYGRAILAIGIAVTVIAICSRIF